MGIVRQRVAVLVLQRLDSAAANVLRFAATRAFRVYCHVKLIGINLEEGGCDQLVDGRGERRLAAGSNPTVGQL